MENEKLHQLSQELINQLNSSTYLHGPKHQESKNLSPTEWNELINPLLKKKYVEKSSNTLFRLTSRGKKLTGDRYLRIEKQYKVEKQQKEKKELPAQKKLVPERVPVQKKVVPESVPVQKREVPERLPEQKKVIPERPEMQELSGYSGPTLGQKIMFWVVSIVGIIGSICGILALWIQLHAKPIIEKKYIPVDSHGKTYDLKKNE